MLAGGAGKYRSWFWQEIKTALASEHVEGVRPQPARRTAVPPWHGGIGESRAPGAHHFNLSCCHSWRVLQV